MRTSPRHIVALLALVLCVGIGGCRREADKDKGKDAKVTTIGSVEVTARLAEIPAGAVFKRDLYDYATILKYEVLEVHRGSLQAKTIYVGQYNPTKPRSQAADRWAKGIGGTATSFTAGRVQRMALEVPMEDHYMGGIVNKYFPLDTGPLYWAVWTNTAD